MWAMGAIAAELFTLRPLFPGSSEMDELYRICSVIGTPTDSYPGNTNSGTNQNYDLTSENNSVVLSGGGSWSEGIRLASAMGFKFPTMPPVPLSNLIPNASTEALQLISDMLKWDPNSRPTAQESLQYPWFKDIWSNASLKDSLLAGTLNKDDAAKNSTKKTESDTKISTNTQDKKSFKKQSSNSSSMSYSNNTLSSPTGSFDFDIDDDGNIIKSKNSNRNGHVESNEALSNNNNNTSFSNYYSNNNSQNNINNSASTLTYSRSLSNSNNGSISHDLGNHELSSRSSRKSLFRSESTKKNDEEKLFNTSSNNIINQTDSLFNTNNENYSIESTSSFKIKPSSSSASKSGYNNSIHNSDNINSGTGNNNKESSFSPKLDSENSLYQHNSISHNSNSSISGLGMKNIKRYHSPTEEMGLSSSFSKLSLSNNLNNGSLTSEGLTKNKLKPMNSNGSIEATNDFPLDNADYNKMSFNGLNYNSSGNKSLGSNSGSMSKINQYSSNIYAPHTLVPKSQNNSSDSINNVNYLNYQSSFGSNNINQRLETSGSVNNSRHFSNNHHDQSLNSLSNGSINGHHQSLPSRPSKYKQLPAIDNQVSNKSFLKSSEKSMNDIFHESKEHNKSGHKNIQTPPNLEGGNATISSNNSLNILQHPTKLNSLPYNTHNASGGSLSSSLSSHPSLLKPLLTTQSKTSILNDGLSSPQYQKPVKLESLNSFDLNNVRRPSRGEDFTKL